MKKLLFYLLLMCVSISSFSQQKTITEDIKLQYLQVDSSDFKTVYCEIVGIQKFLSKQVTVSMDFGQEQSFFTENRLIDAYGKLVVFNSMVDAINYMGERGWTLHSTMLIGQGNQFTYHFVMQKKIKIK